MKEVHIVVTVAIDPLRPSVLYAGTTGGAYRSLDGGGRWQKINDGLIPSEILDASLALGVNALMIDPQQTDTVYAGTTKGLFKSVNKGDSWVRIGATMTDQYISSLAIDRNDPHILYAGGRAGIQKSFDAGLSWKTMNTGLASTNIRTIAMGWLDPHILYAGTNGSGLYYSENGGETWKKVPILLKANEHSTGSS